MKLTVTRDTYQDAGRQVNRTVQVMQTCCSEMRAAWDSGFIGYGNPENDADQANRDVNIYKYDSDDESWSALSINYCPFCSAAIEIHHAR